MESKKNRIKEIEEFLGFTRYSNVDGCEEKLFKPDVSLCSLIENEIVAIERKISALCDYFDIEVAHVPPTQGKLQVIKKQERAK